MRCCNSYQEIETPEEMEEENTYERILEGLLQEFDPEEAAANNCSYASFKANCQKRARMAIERIRNEEPYDGLEDALNGRR